MAKQNNRKGNSNQRKSEGNKSSKGFKPVREQPRKDSRQRRINLDNARVDKVAEQVEEDSRKYNANSIDELNRNPELLRSAGSLPYATILGTRYGSKPQTVPGVMTVFWEPGLASNSTETIMNKAFQQIYSFIVHANSRNYKYEYTDLAIYCLAGIEIFAALADAIRVYGTAKSYSEENLYYGNGLMMAQGFNPKDIRDHLGQMWFDINNLIIQTRQIWIPDVFPLLKRWIRLNSHMYTDAQGKRSQTYLYARQHYFMLSETACTAGACLVQANMNNTPEGSTADPAYNVFSRLPAQSTPNGASRNSLTANDSGKTWYQFKSMIQLMIDQLVASQDRGMIFGDILNAYGKDRIYAMPEIDVNYTVFPEYNAEVLAQIENLTTAPAYSAAGLFQRPADVLSPEVGKAVFQGIDSSFKAATINYTPATQILNFHVEGQPTPEFIAVATRMKVGSARVLSQFANFVKIDKGSNTAIFDPTTGVFNPGTVAVNQPSSNITMFTTCGTEVPVATYMLKIAATGTTAGNFNWTECIQYNSGDSALGDVLAASMLLEMSYDWHPFIYCVDSTPKTSTNLPARYLLQAGGDFDNYIELEDVNLQKLHDVCMYSEFGIPQLG